MNSAPARAVRPAVPIDSSLPMLPVAPRRAARLQCRGAVARGRARGFTLIEIVVAFVILALGLGIAMQIATGAMRNSRRAAERTDAALYAQSLLDSVGVGERLEEGETSGEFGDAYRWTLAVETYEIESDAAVPLEPGLAPVQLYRLELVVTWGRDRAQQEAHFVTLRALTPDPGV